MTLSRSLLQWDAQRKRAFENVLLSTHGNMGNLELQLKNRAVNFDYFFLGSAGCCDARDTAHLLIFLCGIPANFKITEELADVQSMKGTTTGNDFFTAVNTYLTCSLTLWSETFTAYVLLVTQRGEIPKHGERHGQKMLLLYRRMWTDILSDQAQQIWM